MTVERFTLDSNVLVYFADSSAGTRHLTAIAILQAAPRTCLLTNQALAEFFSVAVRKLHVPAPVARRQVANWMVLFPEARATRSSLDRAMEEAATERFSFWDAHLLAAAEEAGCTVALSEDMQDGSTFGNLRIVNPFSSDGALSSGAREVLKID